MATVQDRIDSLRRTALIARGDLFDAVNEACPGDHSPQQHRDRRPPWCPLCGRDNLGRVQKVLGDTT
jgi:hypothetical protein